MVNQEDRELNLWDMFWATCQKWRSILLCAVIVMLLAGAYSYYSSAQTAKAQAQSQGNELTADELGAKLSKEEMAQAEAYLNNVTLHEKMNYYIAHSPLMKLDANNFYQGELVYYIDNDSASEDESVAGKGAAMVKAYQTALKSQELAEKIAEAYGEECDSAYAGEVFEFSDIANDVSQVDKSEEVINGTVVVNVCAKDEESCKDILALAKKNFESAKADVVKALGNHKLILAGEEVRKTSDEDLLDYQNAKVNEDRVIAEYIKSAGNSFTDAQIAYVARISHEEGKSTEEDSADAVKVSASVSKKMLVIGFFAGAFMAFACWLLVYIFDAKIRLEDPFEMFFSSALLGNVPVSEKNKKKKLFGVIDLWLKKIRHFKQRYFEKEEAIDMLVANIKIVAKKNEISQVVLTGASWKDEEKELLTILSEKLNESEIELIYKGAILYNAEALEEMAAVGTAILVERAGASLCSEVKKEIEICNAHKIHLIGCVVTY